jgi:hypothetical protein
VAAPEASGRTLDELLGPPGRRPGELHEPLRVAVPARFRATAREIGVSTSLGVSVCAERWMVLQDLGELSAEAAALLDATAASARCELPLSAANADYARLLLAALHGRCAPKRFDDAVIVIPLRLSDRLSAVPTLRLMAGELRPALAWELAALRAGRTMTEWALAAALSCRYPVSAERHSLAAASAAP